MFFFLWAYRGPWVCAPVGVRRAWLSIALLTIWGLVMDLAAQIVETLAVWTLTHHQPCFYPTSAWLRALRTTDGEVAFYRCKFVDEKKELTAMFSCQNMPVLCETTLVCPSYLSPAAIHPLWTWPWFAGSLLAGSAAIFTAVGRVAVLILAHYHTPLEASCTCAGALFLGFFNRDKRARK